MAYINDLDLLTSDPRFTPDSPPIHSRFIPDLSPGIIFRDSDEPREDSRDS
jgi:hypothetical protein